jgi:hypothetical protein
MCAYYSSRKCCHWDFAFLSLLFLCRLSLGHAPTYLVCSHSNQNICFNLTYHPWEQWLEIQSICIPGNLVSHTQVLSPEKSLSMFFESYVAIDQGGYGGIGYDCGVLNWERAYTSNEKYMCRRNSSWPCDDVGSYYCPYWSCVSWATWERTEHTALFHKGTVAPNCTPGTRNPINFTVLKPSDCTRDV